MMSSGSRHKYCCISSPNSFSGEFELKKVIGQGAFSDVYLCVRRDDERKYAAKVLKKDYGQTMDETAWKTVSELNVANSMTKHPFILSIVMAYHEQQSGKVILLTELMSRSLYDIITEGQCPLSDIRIRDYMYQMLEGLKYLHESGFIHRDIKPENILLKCRDKWLKIGDLGSTCNVTQEQQYTEYVATRWYRPPECLLTRGRYSTKLDIWAAGCVLYEIATGNALFDGKDEDDQMEKIDRVLGCPDLGLINKFKKYKSEVFVNRYEKRKDCEQINAGVGLHTMYQPFKPAYEILKEMIVCNPIKRFSADRLLRKPYFYTMKYTRYEYKINEFYEKIGKNTINCNLSAGDKETISKNTELWRNKKGPSGDRIPDLQMESVPNGDQFVLDYTNENMNLIDIEYDGITYADNETQYQIDKCLQDAIDRRNNNIIQKTEFVLPNVRTRTLMPSKISKTISFPVNEHMTTSSISTSNRIPIIKQVKKTMNNRPPFK